MLLPCQLGVGSPGGVEPAVFLLEEAIAGSNKAEIVEIASLDLLNAFNALDRASIASAVARYAPSFYRAAAWAYNRPSILLTDGGSVLASAQGVRQGDPLGAFLFSLAFRPTLERLIRDMPFATFAAYLDDVYILSRKETDLVRRAAPAFRGSPLTLNQGKSSSARVSSIRETGLHALGTYIGPLSGRRAFLSRKIDSLSHALEALFDLPCQHALLLLCSSTQLLLRHLLRQLDPIGLEDLWDDADKLIQQVIGALASRDPAPFSTPDFSPVRQALIALPARDGGLGIPLHRALAQGIYRAARASSFPLLDRISSFCLSFSASPSSSFSSQPPFAPEGPPTPSAREVLSTANKEALDALSHLLPPAAARARLENASFLGRQWLRVLPTQKQLQFADPEAKEALRARLLLPCRPLDRACRFCATIPALGHEDVCKGAARRWISRHDQVSRAFQKALACRDDLVVQKEPLASSGSLRADFSVLLGAARYYYDVQVVAVNKESAKEGAYETLAEAAAEKRRKYAHLGAFFVPLIFSAGGLMEKETAKAYKSLQKLLGPIASSWLDTSLGVILAKTRAVSAVSISHDNPR
jgi:hypothetical protein